MKKEIKVKRKSDLPLLYVVVPCYNEGASLPLLYEELKKLIDGENGYEWEVLLVNDGSKDRTWEKIKALHELNPRFKGLNLAHNVGHQNAIFAGMMTARNWADAVITIDADLQDDIECIPQMVKNFEEGNDIVYGVKVSRQADPFMKRMSAMAFYKLQNSMGVESVYNHADFRLMSKRALDMLADYKETNLYLRGLIPQIGLKSTTVDDVISERYAGTSKYTLKKMLNLALNGITAFSVKPMYAITYLGVLFLIITFCIAIYVVRAIILGTAVPGWSSLILSIWLVGGFQLIAMGIVGIYIGKIFTEVKRRPLYHIAEILE